MKKTLTTIAIIASMGLTHSVLAQDDFSKGSNYHLIYLDEFTAAKIPAGQIVTDLRIDDTQKFLYIWDNTYNALTSTGPNWNGEVGEYMSFSVGNAGWSGMGFCAVAPLTLDLSSITSDYTFHIAMKSTSTNSHLLILAGGNGLEGKACIGSQNFEDAGKSYVPVTNFTRDGQWHVVEIPMSTFFNGGLRYPEPFNGNYLVVLSGGQSGTRIDMDAIYIYKKNTSTAVKSTKGNNVSVSVQHNKVTLPNAVGPVDVYSLTGTKVKTSAKTTFDVSDLAKGIYIVKSGDFVGKIQVK
ncbi:MAG: T9SS type A sorting domain-containing protein [Breznakibacter sp.]